MYLTKLAQRNGGNEMSVTYSDLASVIQVLARSISPSVTVFIVLFVLEKTLDGLLA
jgi:hypothetical protein